MIEEGLFTHFLKPLFQKKAEKDAVFGVLNKYVQKECDFEIKGLCVRVKNLSQIYKKELLLQREIIERDLEQTLSKKYTISF
jgi:hypothetical protein